MASTATVTVLFTDVEGSSSLTQRLGDAGAREVLREHEGIVREALKVHGGAEVKTMGDGFMASFSSATRALECAIAMQRTFARHNESADEPIQVRIGLNAGEPIAEEEDLFGTAVITTARIAAKAAGGEILASDVVRQLAAGKGFPFADRGEMALRGFDDPVHLYELMWHEEETPASASITVADEKPSPSIAVLPFADMSPQKDQEYFCDGMAEELINALTQVEGLRIVARTSAFSFKGKELDVRDIGKKLNVEAVLEGSVRKAGNRLRITTQLINVADGYHLWSEKYDRDMEDIFAIQDEISQAIVHKLKVKLLGEEKAQLVKCCTEDLEAYTLYLKGRWFWNKRGEEGLKKAIEYFERAIERDPNFALAYAGLADSYVILPQYSPFSPKEAYPEAMEAALKALELDDTLAEAHTSLAYVKTLSEWDREGAEAEFKRAIELNPGYATARLWYTNHLMFVGRFEEAIKEIKRAHELDPLSLIINRGIGDMHYYGRQYDQAIEAFEKTIELDPNSINVYLRLGMAYLEKSMYEEALAAFQKEREVLKDWNPIVETWVGIAYAKMGKQDEARKALHDLLDRSKEVYVPPAMLARLYFALGENDQGFDWLDKAYEERDQFLVWSLKIEPTFDGIRSDPRYTALLKKLGLEQ